MTNQIKKLTTFFILPMAMTFTFSLPINAAETGRGGGADVITGLMDFLFGGGSGKWAPSIASLKNPNPNEVNPEFQGAFDEAFKACSDDLFPGKNCEFKVEGIHRTQGHTDKIYGKKGRRSCHHTGKAMDFSAIRCGGGEPWSAAKASGGAGNKKATSKTHPNFTKMATCLNGKKGQGKTLNVIFRDGETSMGSKDETTLQNHIDHIHIGLAGCLGASGRK